MSRPRVYLGGPVTGRTYDEAMAWRREVGALLERLGFAPVFPMEAEEKLKDRGPLRATGEDGVPGCSAEEIFDNDLRALRSGDYVLANLLGAERVSIGSVWELGYAFGIGLRTVVVAEQGGLHDHIFVRHGCDQLVSTIGAALAWLYEVEQSGIVGPAGRRAA